MEITFRTTRIVLTRKDIDLAINDFIGKQITPVTNAKVNISYQYHYDGEDATIDEAYVDIEEPYKDILQKMENPCK